MIFTKYLVLCFRCISQCIDAFLSQNYKNRLRVQRVNYTFNGMSMLFTDLVNKLSQSTKHTNVFCMLCARVWTGVGVGTVRGGQVRGSRRRRLQGRVCWGCWRTPWWTGGGGVYVEGGSPWWIPCRPLAPSHHCHCLTLSLLNH